jgi:selenide,water dikinase
MSIRLTQYSHGGGCGCKISPTQLREILQKVPLLSPDPNLLVGADTSDDAAVYRISETQALVLTTDFFMPIVDDPVDFGRIAATNALSDVYAMGGSPILALAVLGMPINTLPMEAIQGIMQGGSQVCQEAGIPLAGGHSIDSPEPIFGLVAAGLIDLPQVRRNATAQPGDVLILTKPLGIGIMTTALKKGSLSEAGYQEVLGIMTQLNRVGSTLSQKASVHAMTDVTGFGLLGHLLEVCRGSGLGATLQWEQVPTMAEAVTLAQAGIFPGAAQRNWEGYTGIQADALMAWEQLLLADPQTSGGLLLAVDPAGVEDVMELLRSAGHPQAAIIGHCGPAGIPTISVAKATELSGHPPAD